MLEKLMSSQSRAFVVIAVALALAGLVSGLSLPVGLFPQIAFPRVVVDLDAGSRPATQMALLVTRPVEEAVRTIPGVQNVRSETSRGSAQVSIDFGWGLDMVASTLLVQSAIARTVTTLPPGTSYDVRRMDPTVFPIISYALVSDTASPIALQDLARYQITPLLAAIPGLARVAVQGGETAEVEVLADPARLANYGLAINDLATAIRSGNVLSAVGQVQDRGKLSLVLADRSVIDASRSATSSYAPIRTVLSACATLLPCRTVSSRNICASSRTGDRQCCSTSTSSPTAMPSRSPRPLRPILPASSFLPGSSWSTGTIRANR